MGKSEENRTITIVLHSDINQCPIVHFYGKENFIRIPFVEYLPHFWCFKLENINPGEESFEICLTPSLGPSQLINLHFGETQPFVFLDLSVERNLVPFDQFYEFFSTSIKSGFLTFSFNAESPISSIKQFLSSFDDNYFVWALTYVSLQPWRALFSFNEEFAKMLISFVLPFITRNFIVVEPDDCVSIDNYAYYTNPVDINEISPHKKSNASHHYKTLGQYADVMLVMVREQLGDAISYMLSIIIDANQDFPFTSYVPPFGSNRVRFVEETEEAIYTIYKQILTLPNSRMEQAMLRLAYTTIAVYTDQFKTSISRMIESVKIDFALIDLIIKLRMFESEKVFPESLRALYNQLPLENSEIASGDAIVPPEWLNCFFEIFKVKQDDRNTIAEESIKLSVPRHILQRFFGVTNSGALVMKKDVEAVLQPGCIVQPHADIPNTSMIMSESVATDGSTLSENSFVPPDAIIISQGDLIDESALISTPVKIGRGAAIHKDAVICSDVKIGRGAIVEEGAVIGQGASLGYGCLVEKGEIVPPGFIVPCGFRFSQSAVEDCTKIQTVITMRGTRFTKQSTSFAIEDLTSIENVDFDFLLKGYFELMKSFPKEAGKQLALHTETLKTTENTAKIIVSVYASKVLSLAISYWNNAKKECKEWDKVIVDACNSVIEQFTVAFNDFEKCGTSEFILDVAQNYSIFREKGINETLLEQMKKEIFESCDELLLRLSLVSTTKTTKLNEILAKIIELTKPTLEHHNSEEE